MALSHANAVERVLLKSNAPIPAEILPWDLHCSHLSFAWAIMRVVLPS